MKTLVTLGWVVLGLEALFVALLFAQKNMGDDAAGRGMATGFAMLLAPVVVVAGALLLWGQRGGPAPALWLALAVILAPIGYGAVNFTGGMLRKVERALGRAQYGKFDDPQLTRMARAIDARDSAALERLVREKTPDWSARDRRDHTILGHAIHRALEYGAGPGSIEAVRTLLAAGAPPAMDVLKPERTPASISEHDLVYHLFGCGESATAVLDLVLSAGASPNAVDEDGRPILFSTYARVASLEVLARHGAKLDALDTRSDQLGWTALMQWAYFRSWDLALFFLEHGVPVGYTAPDGRDLRNILDEVDPPGTTDGGDDEIHHAAFLAALAAHTRSAPKADGTP